MEPSLREDAVDELDADGSLANRGCDALHAVRPDVTDGENARATRFEQERRTLELPTGEVFAGEILARPHEALFVERDAILEPPRIRARARHEEDVADGKRERLFLPRVDELDPLEASV